MVICAVIPSSKIHAVNENINLLLDDCIFYCLWLVLTQASLVGKYHMPISTSTSSQNAFSAYNTVTTTIVW